MDIFWLNVVDAHDNSEFNILIVNFSISLILFFYAIRKQKFGLFFLNLSNYGVIEVILNF